MQSVSDDAFMRIAFEEAQKATGHVSPNPLVGAVIVMNDKVVARGYHKRSGSYHAEIEAINNCSENLKGATLYSTLEPCCHTAKKTPPCVPSIIKSGIRKVVISNLDPNPMVSGNGIRLLRENGIEVIENVLNKEGHKLNEVFFHHIVKKKPFIHLKAAQTLDGKIQTSSGDSKWISNEVCRTEAHSLRLKYDAVLIGRNTLNNDNPKLNIRMGISSNGKIPRRIIVGNPDKFNWDCEILKDKIEKNIYIIGSSTCHSLGKHEKEILSQGVIIANKTIKDSLSDIYQNGVMSILVEGGSKILSTFLEEGLFNKITLFQAPKLIGNGAGIFSSKNKLINESVNLKIIKCELLENNLKLELEKLCSPEL